MRVLITSHATYDWADEQWQAVGIDPRLAQFVVAKNPMNFHNVYDNCAAQIHILDTHGPTPAMRSKNAARSRQLRSFRHVISSGSRNSFDSRRAKKPHRRPTSPSSAHLQVELANPTTPVCHLVSRRTSS